ncbi:ABC transporter substrate-binding protein [Salibacterium aidingense]|uniref:ABC transporter substrate-binding protein n=1 Tax=Salibacterium aidingense TaxID=384933 RepID=UPI0004187649|nr:extracellular solute-binding protein [Salibacterium aidingense]
MYKEKSIFCFLLVVFSTLMIAGCSPGGETNEENAGNAQNSDSAVNLRVLHSFSGSQPQAPVIEPALEEFDEEHSDVTLDIQTAPGNDILEQLRTEMSAGDPPDVFTHWGMRRVQNYIENGLLPDLSESIEADSDMEDRYIEDAYNPVEYQGGIYGLPFQGYSYYLLINPELFEEHGVEVPTTYEELVTAVEQFNDAGLIPFAANNHSARYMMLTWFAQKNDTDSLIKYATAEEPFGEDLRDAADKVAELSAMGAFPEGYQSLETAQSFELFRQGQAPMFYQHSWTAGEIDPEMEDQYEVIPFPLGDQASTPTTIAGTGHFIYMSKEAYEDPEKREAAWELMKKIAGPEVGRKFVEEIPNPTALNVEYDPAEVSPVMNQIMDFIENDENVVPSYDEQLFSQDVEDDYWSMTDQLLQQDLTPEQYVEEMNALIEEYPSVQFE